MVLRRAALLALAVVGLAGAAALPQGAPALFLGYQRAAEHADVSLRSVYVPMRDGVRLAVDVVLPADLPAGTRLPAILGMTPYWRGRQGEGPTAAARFYALRGYAAVRADVRGTGASFGLWRGPQSPAEVTDGGDLVAWIVGQPWSSGRVGAVGVSYEGSAAQMLLVPGHPAVKAVIPKFHELDVFTDLAFPGGVPAERIVSDWAAGQQRLVAGEGVRRVDDDASGDLLKQALALRGGNLNVLTAMRRIVHRDDRAGDVDLTLDDVSVYRHKEAIERSGAAIFGWGSWMDAATADACIRRFVSFGNPQQAVIGAWSHGAVHDANPFREADAAVVPPRPDQQNEELRFFDRTLKDLGEPAPRALTYYVMGEEVWRTTDVWPIPGTSSRRLFFAAGNALSTAAPTGADGTDRYTVDFEATTGTRNRWHTENGGGDVVYEDRAPADRRLLTYTSEPLTEDTEITGYPIARLALASTATDGAVFVYLEEVDPSGRVTYLTEGVLRALHRKTRTFTRADAAPLVPGEMASLEIGLQPISVLLPAGHRLRVAIAGADKETFARVPAAGTPVLTIGRSRDFPSSLELPVVSRPHARPAPRPARVAAAPAPALAAIESPRPSPPTTPAAILDRYVEALGGREAIEKLASRVSIGTFSVVERGVTRPVELSVKTPRFALRIGGEPPMGAGYDGETGWDLDYSSPGLKTFTGEQAAGHRRQGDLQRELRLKEELQEVELKGMARVGGRPAYVLEATPKGLRRARLYFDVESGLLVRRDTLGPTAQSAPVQINLFEDYRRVEGRLVPFTVRTQLPAATHVFRYDTIRFDVPVDDAVFRVPSP